eukprot:scaffold7663_cov57-Phaeocystis_antarctica.AAC.3
MFVRVEDTGRRGFGVVVVLQIDAATNASLWQPLRERRKLRSGSLARRRGYVTPGSLSFRVVAHLGWIWPHAGRGLEALGLEVRERVRVHVVSVRKRWVGLGDQLLELVGVLGQLVLRDVGHRSDDRVASPALYLVAPQAGVLARSVSHDAACLLLRAAVSSGVAVIGETQQLGGHPILEVLGHRGQHLPHTAHVATAVDEQVRAIRQEQIFEVVQCGMVGCVRFWQLADIADEHMGHREGRSVCPAPRVMGVGWCQHPSDAAADDRAVNLPDADEVSVAIQHRRPIVLQVAKNVAVHGHDSGAFHRRLR